MLTRIQATIKRIAATLGIAVSLAAVAAFGLNGWSELAMSQEPVAVACDSGSGCKIPPERRHGAT